MPQKAKTLAILNVLTFLAVITTNYLAVTLPLNNKTTGQLSDLYPNFFTPAGITFSIWGIIYLFLLGFIIYQVVVLFSSHHPLQQTLVSISPLFIVNGLANVSWLFAWHYQQVALSVLIMLVILSTLITIHTRLHLAWQWKPLMQKLLVDAPFSLYLGWISIATIANITSLLVSYQWNANNSSLQANYTIIMLIAGALLTVFMVMIKRNLLFGAVVLWAFYGIIIKRSSAGGIYDGVIVLWAEICIWIIAGFMLLVASRRANL